MPVRDRADLLRPVRSAELRAIRSPSSRSRASARPWPARAAVHRARRPRRLPGRRAVEPLARRSRQPPPRRLGRPAHRARGAARAAPRRPARPRSCSRSASCSGSGAVRPRRSRAPTCRSRRRQPRVRTAAATTSWSPCPSAAIRPTSSCRPAGGATSWPASTPSTPALPPSTSAPTPDVPGEGGDQVGEGSPGTEGSRPLGWIGRSRGRAIVDGTWVTMSARTNSSSA